MCLLSRIGFLSAFADGSLCFLSVADAPVSFAALRIREFLMSSGKGLFFFVCHFPRAERICKFACFFGDSKYCLGEAFVVFLFVD